MNILGLTQRNSGCGYHRIILPLAFMEDITAHITNLPLESDMQKHWDILFYNRLSVFDDKLQVVKDKGMKIRPQVYNVPDEIDTRIANMKL